MLAPDSGVTSEMAVGLAELDGSRHGLWLRMQRAHDLRAEQAVAEVIAATPTLRAPAA